jgi:hypothetical protein
MPRLKIVEDRVEGFSGCIASPVSVQSNVKGKRKGGSKIFFCLI